MSWIPIAERFAVLPLILAGPILRRVEPQSVTVWLSMKEPCTVTLRVYAKNDAGEPVEQEMLELPPPDAAPPIP